MFLSLSLIVISLMHHRSPRNRATTREIEWVSRIYHIEQGYREPRRRDQAACPAKTNYQEELANSC